MINNEIFGVKTAALRNLFESIYLKPLSTYDGGNFITIDDLQDRMQISEDQFNDYFFGVLLRKIVFKYQAIGINWDDAFKLLMADYSLYEGYLSGEGKPNSND